MASVYNSIFILGLQGMNQFRLQVLIAKQGIANARVMFRKLGLNVSTF